MSFWRGKRVLITGHTGFKGAWLGLWLTNLGAEVSGFALAPPTTPSLFEKAGVASRLRHVLGDVRDRAALADAMRRSRPEIIFHMAAQSLVRQSYDEPVETYEVNVMGTVNLLEAARHTTGLKAVVCVTSDKCYENPETGRPCREDDAMGGYDPYSSSKGCAELVVSAYRRSFFNSEHHAANGPLLASVRAGNVIGGGDWAKDRLVPDLMRGFAGGRRPVIRFPTAVRPWQHVLEPLSGYMRLAERLHEGDTGVAEGWNFGPDETDARPVGWVADRLSALWGDGAEWVATGEPQPHEAGLLRLDCAKARERLDWRPRWSLDQGLAQTVAWYKGVDAGADVAALTMGQIQTFADAGAAALAT